MSTTAPTPLTHTRMDAIVQEHFEAEGRADIPAILATYAEHIEFDVCGNPAGAVTDRQAIAGFYAALFSEIKDMGIRPLRRWYGTNHLVDESLITGTAVGHPFGLDGTGRTIEFRLLHVFEFSGDHISRESDWMDLPAIMRQLA